MKHFALKPAPLRVAVTSVLSGAYPLESHVTELGGVRVTFPPAVTNVISLELAFLQFLRSLAGLTVLPGFSIQYAAISIIQALAIGSA